MAALERYLDLMAAERGGSPRDGGPVVVAALGPRMLELCARRGVGVHPWNVTSEHTAAARAMLGRELMVAPRQAVMLCTNRDDVLAASRAHLRRYLQYPNYVCNWQRQGFSDDDLSDGGSERLVEAMVAWGAPERALERVAEHRDAGADHVVVQALPPPGESATSALLEIAQGLTSAVPRS